MKFERFFLGGDGMGMYNLDGRENIPLRGYPNQSLSAQLEQPEEAQPVINHESSANLLKAPVTMLFSPLLHMGSGSYILSTSLHLRTNGVLKFL